MKITIDRYVLTSYYVYMSFELCTQSELVAGPSGVCSDTVTVRQESKTMTQHNHQVIFGRKEADCPRCEELKNGAKPRDGWQKSYFVAKKRNEAARIEAIRNHNCVESKCGTVCTAFDW